MQVFPIFCYNGFYIPVRFGCKKPKANEKKEYHRIVTHLMIRICANAFY